MQTVKGKKRHTYKTGPTASAVFQSDETAAVLSLKRKGYDIPAIERMTGLTERTILKIIKEAS